MECWEFFRMKLGECRIDQTGFDGIESSKLWPAIMMRPSAVVTDKGMRNQHRKNDHRPAECPKDVKDGHVIVEIKLETQTAKLRCIRGISATGLE